MKQSHILFILDHFYPYIGGGEVLFWELTRGLVAKGNKVTVITSYFDQTLPKYETIEGVEVVRTGSNRIIFQRMAVIAGLSFIKNNKVAIIHGTSFFGLLPSYILKLCTGIKTVVTIHEIYSKLWFHFFLMDWCY